VEGDAVFGEHVADVEVGKMQDVAEGLFVFIAGETAEGDAWGLLLRDGFCDLAEEQVAVGEGVPLGGMS
jgi:hypothetical protein